ncbi:MAG: spiro-SPASM protein [Brevinematales bacterium]|nr:spiro-SPASM protein [Brevinematales bacterium]
MLIALLIDNIDFFEEKEDFINITIEKLKPIVDKIYFLGGKRKDSLNFTKAKELFSFLKNKHPDTNVLILNACSPFLDIALTQEMISEHLEYVFDYTYPENLPAGILPEIFDTAMLEFFIPTIPEELPVFKNSIREIIEGEISSYDCNIFITDTELSKYRIDFIPNNLNNLNLIKEIIEKNSYSLSLKKLEEILIENPSFLRQRPTYYEIEVSTEREKGEIFASNHLKRSGFIKIEDFKKIVEEIHKFSYNPVVSLGLYGEVFLHPEIDSIIEVVSSYKDILFIFESRGLYQDIEKIKKTLTLKNVKIIFDMSFIDPDKFRLYKSPLNDIIPSKELSTIEKDIKNLDNKEKIYIQFTRTKVNEEELMKFYENWSEFKDRIIIKKLDTFCGLLVNQRVVDLSPVKRFFCYHLKNDMVIFFNGDVPLCRQDLNGSHIVGNIFKDGIKNCWENGNEYFLSHFNGSFEPEKLCKNCDEWWIFNF